MPVQDLFCVLYRNIRGRNRISSFIRFLLRRVGNKVIALSFRLCKSSVCDKDENDIIVSLTSFPKRIHYVWLTIESIFQQTLRPRKVILWLSSEQFEGMNSLPKSLTNLIKRGLEIRFVEGDVKSHKKYLYAFSEFPNSKVILVDDDIIYESNMIELLYNAYVKSNIVNAVVCRYGFIIKFNGQEILPYNSWKREWGVADKNVFFGSGGGSLFVPKFLYDDTCKIETTLNLTPTADDVWLNSMARLGECPIIKIPDYGSFFPIIVPNNTTLDEINNLETNKFSPNDMQLANVIKHYRNLNKVIFKEEV